MLMNENGQVKLCDMGLAKTVIGKTYTMCGTPEYMSPEVVRQAGHGVSTDWWSLGCMIYELMDGATPFVHYSRTGMFQKINKGIEKIQWPKHFSKGEKELIKGLCHSEPSRRIPMLEGGPDLLKKAELFSKTEWFWLGTKDGMEQRVPFKPIVNMDTVCKGRVHKDDIESIKRPYQPVAGVDPFAGF
jgi:serine/threonine protein kinase